MESIRGFLPFRQRRSQRHSNAAACPSTPKAPNEILLEIIGYLDLHDEFLLSQTCRAFRNLTQRDWRLAVRQLSYAKQMQFWTGLAYVLPDYWVCGQCGKLHAMNKYDGPKDDPRSNIMVPPCQLQLGLKFHRVYQLRHTHVQLALKLTRMGSFHQKYLAYIMAPFATETMSSISSRLRLKYHAIPKIVAQRFLLQVKHEFRDGDDKTAVSPSELRVEGICPHMIIMPSDWRPFGHRADLDLILSQRLGLDGLSRDVNLAFDDFGMPFSGYCKRCPTDYIVVANPGVVTIYSWHDLGSYTTPFDPQWTLHIRSRGKCFQPWPYPDVAHHQPGRIRDMYFEGSINASQ